MEILDLGLHFMSIVDLLSLEPHHGLLQGLFDNLKETVVLDDEISMHRVVAIGILGR